MSQRTTTTTTIDIVMPKRETSYFAVDSAHYCHWCHDGWQDTVANFPPTKTSVKVEVVSIVMPTAGGSEKMPRQRLRKCNKLTVEMQIKSEMLHKSLSAMKPWQQRGPSMLQSLLQQSFLGFVNSHQRLSISLFDSCSTFKL